MANIPFPKGRDILFHLSISLVYSNFKGFLLYLHIRHLGDKFWASETAEVTVAKRNRKKKFQIRFQKIHNLFAMPIIHKNLLNIHLTNIY